jgi:hypothetical protein
MRARAALALAIAMLCGPATARADRLQPGAALGVGCTANFVYDGVGPAAGRVFLGTAAHCVKEQGERVKDGAGREFGTVALLGDYREWHSDFALIEVDPPHHQRVEPSMAGHPTLPTRVASGADAEIGDFLQMSGWGGPFAPSSDTRENRRAVLTEYDAARFNSLAPVFGGDSGGPIAHVETGSALGTVSGWSFVSPGNLIGPTVTGIVAQAAQAGVPIRMRAAGEPAPPPPPPPPPPPRTADPPSKAKPKGQAKKKKCAKKKRRAQRRGKRCRTRARR